MKKLWVYCGMQKMDECLKYIHPTCTLLFMDHSPKTKHCTLVAVLEEKFRIRSVIANYQQTYPLGANSWGVGRSPECHVAS